MSTVSGHRPVCTFNGKGQRPTRLSTGFVGSSTVWFTNVERIACSPLVLFCLGTTGSVKPQQHCHDSSGQKQPAQVDGTDSLFGRLFRKRVQDGARDPAVPKGKGTTL